jgi:hypothetical protein
MKTKEKCGAITLSGGPCNLPLGWSTNHSGEGRCANHDNSVEGRVLDTFNVASINERMKSFLSDDNIYNLDKEIVLSRAHLEVISQYIDDLKAEQLMGVPISESKYNINALTAAINGTTKSIAKLLETKNDIEVGRKYVIHISQLQYIISIIGSVIDTNVSDIHTREAIHDGLRRIALPSPD